jgi:two-component system sensor histidine kinase RpfC
MKGAVVVICSPHNIGMSENEFALKTRNVNPHAQTSLILLSPEIQNNAHAGYLAMGYSAMIHSLLDKPVLFNSLHAVLKPCQNTGAISLNKHYAHIIKERRGMHILVADDNSTNRKIISRTLEIGGHHVELVADGVEALNRLEYEQFDLMILDMNMPNAGGLEVVRINRTLSGQSRTTPTIILTANASIEARNLCSDIGIEAYLTKPVDAITLLDTVARLTASISPVDDAERSLAEDKEQIMQADLVNINTLKQLELLGNGRENFMLVLIQEYISETEILLNEMRIALAANEFDTLKEIAHTLKGSAGNMGAKTLHQIFDGMMRSSDDDLKQNGRALFKRAHTCFKSTKIMLEQFLAKSASTPNLDGSTGLR